ncbi:MAG: hypothetical protein EBT86_10640 [Actinobacteria bacterium]|nr:hypothetical protein [Actinomycetota bacterium]
MENAETNTTQVKEALTHWIRIDDEIRELRSQIKKLQEEKTRHGDRVLMFMRDNSVDDFKLEGSSGGSISRSLRTIKPAIKRNTIRTQLLLHFADQPQKVSDALKAIEGVDDDMTSTGIQREILTRRVPRKTRTMELSTS